MFTAYLLILIALSPDGRVTAMTTTPVMGEEVCKAAGESWEDTGLDLRYACIPLG